MRTHLFASLAVVTSAAIASANPPQRAPDFIASRPAHGVDRSLAASSGDSLITPIDILPFQFGQAALLSSSQAQIDSAAAWMRAHPGYRMVIEGHTDHVGTREYNLDLATRRADTVRKRLIAEGVGSDRIVVVVFGENENERRIPDDRRAVIYATDRSPREIALASLDVKHAQTVVWTAGGTLVQEQATGQRPREIIATRK